MASNSGHKKKVIDILSNADQKKYKALFENSLTAIFITESDGTIYDANQAACQMFGYSVEEFRKLGRQGIIDEKSLGLDEKFIEREKTRQVKGELIGIRRNGEKFYCNYSSAIFAETDDIKLNCISLIDINEKKKAELEMKLLINNTEESFILVDKDLRIVSYNSQFKKLYQSFFGISVRKGDYILNYAQPERREVTQKIYERVLKGGEVRDEIVVPTSDKSEKIFDIRYKAARNEQSEIIGAFVTVIEITEQKEILDQVKISGRNYRDLFNSSPLPKIIYDLSSFRICDVNDTAVNHYGYTREEFLQLNLKDLLSDEDGAIFQDLHQRIKNLESIINFGVYSHKKKEGSFIKVEKKGHKINFTGRECMLLVSNDVTDKVKAEETLANERNLLRTLIDNLPDYIYVKDTKSRHLINNKANVELMGASSENETLGKTVKDFFDPELAEIYLKDDGKVLESGIPIYNKEMPLLTKQGTKRWLLTSKIPLKDKDEKSVGIIGISRDVTEAKEREENLKLMESVITNSNDGVLITKADPINDPEGPEIIYVNKAFEKLSGYKKQEVIGKTPRILQGPKTNRTDLDRVRMAIEKKERCECTVINYKKSGEEFWINFSVSPVKNDQGKCTHFISIERDVTEMKNREIQQTLFSEISQIFNEQKDISETLQHSVKKLAALGDFDFAEIWLVDKSKDEIQLSAKYAKSEIFDAFYTDKKEKLVFRKGEGLPGKVWKSGVSQFWRNIDQRKSFLRFESAKNAGLKTAYGFPLIENINVSGVLILGETIDSKREQYFTPILKNAGEYLAIEIKRKKLEDELSRIFSSAPDIICVSGYDGYLKKINPAMSELLGFSENELLSRPITDFIHPDDLRKTEQELAAINRGEGNTYFENRSVTKSGKVIWLSWTLKFYEEEGVIYCVAKDVTEQKELEELLTQANRLAKIGSWEVDLVEDKLYMSPMTRILHEVDPDTQVDLESAINFYKEGKNRDQINHAIENIIEKGTPFDLELQIVTAKGNERWIRAIGESERIEGKCIRIYGSFQDIHQRKITEERLITKTKHINAISQLKSALLNYHDWNIALEEHLEIIGEAVDADRVYYFENRFDQTTGEGFTSQKMEWCRKGVKSQLDNPDLEEIPFTEVPELVDPMINNKPSSKLLSEVPEGSTTEFVMKDQGIKAFLAIPIMIKDTFHGFVGFDNCTLESRWNEEEVATLTTITNTLAIAIERSETDKALQNFFKERNTILESISDNFYALDKNFRFTYLNNSAKKLLENGYKNVVNKSIFELFPDLKSTYFYSKLKEAEKTKKPVRFEHFNKKYSTWFDESIYPKADGYSVFFKDISEKKEAEAKLVEKTSQLDAIAMFNGMLISSESWFIALEKSLKFFADIVNADRIYYFEISFNDTLDENVLSMKLEWCREGIDTQIDNKDHQKLPFSKIKEFIKPLEKGQAFNSLVADIKDDAFKKFLIEQNIQSLMALPVMVNNKFSGIMGFDDCTNERKWREEEISFLKTITINLASAIENKESEKALQKAYDEKNEILESIGDGFFAVTNDFIVTYWNNKAEQLLKTPREKIFGKNLWDIFDDAIELESFKKYNEAINKQVSVQFEDYYDALKMWFEVNAYPSAYGLSVFFKDITDRKNSEAKLQELNRNLEKQTKELAISNAELEQFAFVASHDLQEPLRMITSFLTQLERKYNDTLDEKGKQYIHFATDGARRMRQIILDLLEFSRVGHVNNHKEKVDIGDLLTNEVKYFTRKLNNINGTVSWDNMPVITASKGPLQQVFHNLIGNSIKYCSSERELKVHIFSEETESFWKISVKDNGIGIQPEYREKVFNIFQRLHNQEEYEGTGVGLAICKKIVEEHNGEIWIESNEEEGCTFIFTISKHLQA